MLITGKFLTETWVSLLCNIAWDSMKDVRFTFNKQAARISMPKRYIDYVRAVSILGYNTVSCEDPDMQKMYGSVLGYLKPHLKQADDDDINVSRRIKRIAQKLQGIMVTDIWNEYNLLAYFFVPYEKLNQMDVILATEGKEDGWTFEAAIYFLMCLTVNIMYLSSINKSTLDIPQELALMYLNWGNFPDKRGLIIETGKYIANNNLLAEDW